MNGLNPGVSVTVDRNFTELLQPLHVPTQLFKLMNQFELNGPTIEKFFSLDYKNDLTKHQSPRQSTPSPVQSTTYRLT